MLSAGPLPLTPRSRGGRESGSHAGMRQSPSGSDAVTGLSRAEGLLFAAAATPTSQHRGSPRGRDLSKAHASTETPNGSATRAASLLALAEARPFLLSPSPAFHPRLRCFPEHSLIEQPSSAPSCPRI